MCVRLFTLLLEPGRQSAEVRLPIKTIQLLPTLCSLQLHAQCLLGRRRTYWHEIGDVCSQTFPLAQESSIDFHRSLKLRARHRNIVPCLLLLSVRCVTFHLCPEGRPVETNLTRQSVATDKVRGYSVQPFARRIQLCQHFRFDRDLAVSRISSTPAETRLWDLPATLLTRECPPTQKRISLCSVIRHVSGTSESCHAVEDHVILKRIASQSVVLLCHCTP